MKSFKLDLKVTDSSTKKWQVFLETLDSAGETYPWTDQGNNVFTKTINPFNIMDDSLEVFIRCNGYGGSATCEVTINGQLKGSVTTVSENSAPAKKSFKI